MNLGVLRDFTMLATARWPFNRWRQTGRSRDPILYLYGGSGIHRSCILYAYGGSGVYGGSGINRSCGASSRSSGAGKLHHLSHNSGLSLPPKTGSSDRERQPGIEHLYLRVHCSTPLATLRKARGSGATPPHVLQAGEAGMTDTD
jgi:hypothetical protein